MKAIAYKVRDSICENGEFCNMVANYTLVVAFWHHSAESTYTCITCQIVFGEFSDSPIL